MSRHRAPSPARQLPYLVLDVAARIATRIAVACVLSLGYLFATGVVPT